MVFLLFYANNIANYNALLISAPTSYLFNPNDREITSFMISLVPP